MVLCAWRTKAIVGEATGREMRTDVEGCRPETHPMGQRGQGDEQ